MGAEMFIPQMMSRNEEIIRLIKENKKKKMVGNKKEIVYNNIDRFAVIVATDQYRGVTYVCLNCGIHPAAYVMCTQEFLDKHLDKEYETIDGIHVHNGITYVGMANKILGLEDFDSPCFGWDYGHAGDWAGYMSEEDNINFGNRKYTTEMLINDCESAIDQYLSILEKDEENEKKDPNPVLTSELLKKFGFKSIFGNVSNDEDAFQLSGGDDNGNKWKIFIDLHTPGKSYVLAQSPRQKYEGAIKTLDDLKSIISLFKLPVKFE